MNGKDTSFPHAIVISGNIAGLLAACVLSKHFGRVTILEHEVVNDTPDWPMGETETSEQLVQIAHELTMLAYYFPELLEGIQEHLAVAEDTGTGTHRHAHNDNHVEVRAGCERDSLSRPLLEWHIRRRVLALTNVRMIDQCDVDALLFGGDKQSIRGVQVTLHGVGIAGGKGLAKQTYRADLVVDCSNSEVSILEWLQAAGYESPNKSEVKINTSWVTRTYHRQHFEELQRFPEDFLVMGGAICSYDTVYSLEVFAAVLEARVLDELLTQRQQDNIDSLAQVFFARVAKLVDHLWQKAIASDLRSPGLQTSKQSAWPSSLRGKLRMSGCQRNNDRAITRRSGASFENRAQRRKADVAAAKHHGHLLALPALLRLKQRGHGYARRTFDQQVLAFHDLTHGGGDFRLAHQYILVYQRLAEGKGDGPFLDASGGAVGERGQRRHVHDGTALD